MTKHLYVIQDMRSLNCGEPLLAVNVQEMKRAFALGFCAHPIDRVFLNDTRVLEIADIDFDSETNVPLVTGFSAPCIAFYGSDPDILQLIESLSHFYPLDNDSLKDGDTV